MVKVKRPKAVICDIEGTTTSTKFWGECLVPYIKFKTQQCLKERWNVPTLMELIDGLRKNTTESTTSSGSELSFKYSPKISHSNLLFN